MQQYAKQSMSLFICTANSDKGSCSDEANILRDVHCWGRKHRNEFSFFHFCIIYCSLLHCSMMTTLAILPVLNNGRREEETARQGKEYCCAHKHGQCELCNANNRATRVYPLIKINKPLLGGLQTLALSFKKIGSKKWPREKKKPRSQTRSSPLRVDIACAVCVIRPTLSVQ